MTIEDLYDKLTPYMGKQLSIGEPVFPRGNIVDFCGKLAGGSAFVIAVDAQNGVVLSGDQKQVTVKGNTASFGFGTFDVSMVFSLYLGKLSAGISANFTDKTLSLPGVDWLSLGNPGIDFTASDASVPMTGTIGVDVDLGVKLRLTTALPVIQGIWSLQGTFTDPPSITGITKLIGSVDISQYLQDPFKSIADDLQVQQVGFVCDMNAKKLQNINVNISTPEEWPGWTIAPRVTVKKCNLLLGIDGSKNVSYGIYGTLKVGGIDVFLSALHPGAQQGWIFNGHTGEGEAISLTDLLSDLCKAWGVSLPSGFPEISFKDLDFTLNTRVSSFAFGGTLDITNSRDFTICGKSFKIEFALHIDSYTAGSGRQYSGYLRGMLNVGAANFQLEYDFNDTDKMLKGNWKELEGESIGFGDIAETFGSSDLVTILADIPPSLDLALESASFTYDFTKSELLLTASSKNYGSAIFAAAKIKEKWVFVFALSLTGEKIDMAKLPLVGKELAKVGKSGVDSFKLVVCSGTLPQPDVKNINALIQAAGTQYPTLPDTKEGLSKGVNLSMKLEIGGQSFTAAVDTAAGGKAEPRVNSRPAAVLPAPAPAAAGKPPAGGNTYWITLQKSIGPVNIAQVGIRYSDGALSLVFNVALLASALTIELNGLGIGLKLADISGNKISPVFNLDGISITYTSGPVEISGGFLRTIVNGINQYNGEALIKAAAFNLSALGSYADDREPSLFIFALLNDPPLGGPPYFFVTGVAAGFGYNRGLKIPSIDGVSQFPLTSGFVPGQSSPFKSSDPGAALQVLTEKDIVPITPGEDWLAAGVRFTSFEMLQSYVLLVVEFGTKFEIALLGLSALSVPTGDPYPLVFAELALDARFIPADGILAVDAQLTPDSYLLSTSCKLTGGFAFYLWFSPNEHEGDFVITLGGYHPDFTPPDYYPVVPRLGFHWSLSSQLDIKGDMYFALTPSCLMAGGGLQATWQSGSLKAWFDIGADFLIAWKPYHYQADMYLSFGVSYTFKLDLLFATITKTISVSLGADLSIWGPDFSGIAHIHLWIISFSISFGAGASQEPAPISWEEFKDSFLPPAKSQPTRAARYTALALEESEAAAPVTAADSICSIKVSAGLVKDLDKGAANPENIDWIVKRRGTILVTRTLIPATTFIITIKGNNCNTITIDGKHAKGNQYLITNFSHLSGWLTGPGIGIGPVGVERGALTSNHNIEIQYDDGEVNEDIIFNVTAVLANVPKAAWHKGKVTYDKNAVIKNALVGFEIEALVMPPDQLPPIEKKNLAYYSQDYQPTVTWSQPDAETGPAPPPDPMRQMQDTINSAAVRGFRKSILQSLVKNGFAVNTEVDVADIASEGNNYLSAPPIFSYTYWKN
jgi:hypothetical protein